MKIKRDAFLFLYGKDGKFAQCGTCVFGKSTCGLMGNAKVDLDDGSCDFYIKGFPIHTAVTSFSKADIGYVVRQVRCENCKFFSTGECMFYHKLNGMFPELFDLNEKVSRYDCCNANTPE